MPHWAPSSSGTRAGPVANAWVQRPSPPEVDDDLRHTHATHLLAAGVNPKIVSQRLGQTSVAFTLDLYGHVMPTQQAGAAEAAELLVTTS